MPDGWVPVDPLFPGDQPPFAGCTVTEVDSIRGAPVAEWRSVSDDGVHDGRLPVALRRTAAGAAYADDRVEYTVSCP